MKTSNYIIAIAAMVLITFTACGKKDKSEQENDHYHNHA